MAYLHQSIYLQKNRWIHVEYILFCTGTHVSMRVLVADVVLYAHQYRKGRFALFTSVQEKQILVQCDVSLPSSSIAFH